MSPETGEPEPRRPAPPSLPPAPPPPELLNPRVAHVPLTPMMDFLQRRLEVLEQELTIERERARGAQGLLAQQEALKSQVEGQLKTISDQLRREKAEREGEEMKSHARGRIDSLEKRLDEMHQTWASLLKDAVGQRQAESSTAAAAQAGLAHEQAALKSELAAISAAVSGLASQTAQLAQIGPELRSLAGQLPDDGRRFEGRVAQLLSQFAQDMRERFAAWERKAALETEKQEERLQTLARERAALLSAWEEQNHGLRQESLKERAARETEVSGHITGIAKRLDDLKTGWREAAQDSAEVKEHLGRVIEMLTTPPKAKDAALAALELEKRDLLKALQDRAEHIHLYNEQRRQVEASLGESLAAAARELDEERQKSRLLTARIAELEFEAASGRDKLASAQRLSADKDARLAALFSERDELAKALIAESERLRSQVQERVKADEAWSLRLSELQKNLGAEIEVRSRQQNEAAELRAQLAALTAHLAKSLQEKDSILGEHSNWARDREKLLGTIREKDEMISMLNATFQNMLKKP